MPNEKVLLQKQQYVAELKETVNDSVAGVLVDYKGISVAADTKVLSPSKQVSATVKY